VPVAETAEAETVDVTVTVEAVALGHALGKEKG